MMNASNIPLGRRENKVPRRRWAWNFEERFLERKLDSSGSEQGRVTGFCKYNIGHSSSTKDPNFLEYSSNY
jgi:hypothetical protein